MMKWGYGSVDTWIGVCRFCPQSTGKNYTFLGTISIVRLYSPVYLPIVLNRNNKQNEHIYLSAFGVIYRILIVINPQVGIWSYFHNQIITFSRNGTRDIETRSLDVGIPIEQSIKINVILFYTSNSRIFGNLLGFIASVRSKRWNNYRFSKYFISWFGWPLDTPAPKQELLFGGEYLWYRKKFYHFSKMNAE